MSVDTRGREAAESLRAATRFDIESGLSQLHRTRRRRDAGRLVAASVVLAAVVAGGLLTVPDRDDRLAPVDPGPVRNGSIIHTGDANQRWAGPPTLTGKAPYAPWAAFDQATESFLYVSPNDRLFVIGADGPTAEFECPPSAICGRAEKETFGPGPDELTVPATEWQAAQVVAYDGTLRDTLDLSAVVTLGQRLADLAWSPDRRRLAVGTVPVDGCYPGGATACEARVWVVDRDGGEPRLVYAQATPEELVERRYPDTPVIVDLAWAPDGRSLAMVVAPTFASGAAARSASPWLVALRFQPGQPVRTDELFAYDDCVHESGCQVLANDFHLEFPFAWSPDGTRIAVTSEGGIAEISAEDGRVLARHPGREVHGPLAWLRERPPR